MTGKCFSRETCLQTPGWADSGFWRNLNFYTSPRISSPVLLPVKGDGKVIFRREPCQTLVAITILRCRPILRQVLQLTVCHRKNTLRQGIYSKAECNTAGGVLGWCSIQLLIEVFLCRKVKKSLCICCTLYIK